MKIKVKEISYKEVDLGECPIYRKDSSHFYKVLNEERCISVYESYKGEMDNIQLSYASIALSSGKEESNEAEFKAAFEKVSCNLARIANGD